MPCYDERNEPDYVRREALAEFRHNSDVAQMLCTLLTGLKPETLAKLPADIRQWWTEHQARDATRARR